MTAKEHDIKLYWQAFGAGYDYGLMEKLESLCLTEEGAKSIRRLSIRRYHEEEARADMI